MTPTLDPTRRPHDRCHKKRYYDLESIQKKTGITQAEIDEAWAKREPETSVFLKVINGEHFFISNYTP